MKKIIYLCTITLTILLFGCSQDNGIIVDNPAEEEENTYGNAAFSFKNSTLQNKSENSGNTTPTAIVISVSNEDNEQVLENERYTLTSLNGSYLTGNIELLVGNYSLTAFNVINSDNEIILSTPLAGSEFADLVSNPLPLAFTVTEADTTNVIPEVLRVNEGDTAEDFGYASFSFDIVETQNFYITLIDNSGVDPISIGGALSITYGDDSFSTSKDLLPGVNSIRIPVTEDQTDLNLVVYALDEEKIIGSYFGAAAQTTSTNPMEVVFGEDITVDGSIITPVISDGVLNTSESNTISRSQAGINFINADLVDLHNANGYTYMLQLNHNSNTSYITEIQTNSDAYTTTNYSLSNNEYEFFDTILSVDDYLVISSCCGKLFLVNFFSGEYTLYDYVNYSDNFTDNIFVFNNELYTVSGSELYKSTDRGASFEIVNDSLPFSLGNESGQSRQMIYSFANSAIYAGYNNLLYKSNDGGVNFDIVTDGAGDGTSTKLFLDGNDLIIAGNNRFLYGFTTSGELLTWFYGDPNYGAFSSFTVVDGEYRFFFENAVFDYSIVQTESPTPLREGDYFFKEVITSPDQQQVYGIAGNTLYFNLR